MTTPPTYETRETILKAENVSLTLGGKLILRDINLEIRDVCRPGLVTGQVVALLGPSGIGKTRLFRILAGLDSPDTGSVTLGEKKEIVRPGMVGVVAQNYPLFSHRTVIGNLVVAGKQAGQSPDAARRRAKELLSRFNLDDHAGRYPAELSGGQKQRVAIAQQVMCSEHYLLMDEPFSGLDLIAVEHVCELIAEVANAHEANTIIVITHDITAAMEVADTLWVLGRDKDDAGKLLRPGATIRATYNLMDRGLTWRKGIDREPEFIELRREIRDLFPTL